MSVDSAVEQVTRRESRGSFVLWFGVLGSPLAWMTQLVVNYSLEEWFACAPAVTDRGEILGIPVDLFAVVVTTALGAVALASLGSAIACSRRLRSTGDLDPERRARWMALAGILNGVLYSAAIFIGYGVPAILGVCETTP